MTNKALSWQEFATANAELAQFGEARFKEGPAFLATIRKDGSPRVHPVSPYVIEGHLVVFMEPTSPKGQDLLRDPRYSLHSLVDAPVTNGEFLCHGTAKAVLGEMRTKFGMKVPHMKQRYVLFELLIQEAVRTVYIEQQPFRTRWTATQAENPTP